MMPKPWNAIDEIVRQRTFLGFVAEKIVNHPTHLRLDVDDKNFFVIADEQRAAAVGGENAANLHRHNFVLHAENLR